MNRWENLINKINQTKEDINLKLELYQANLNNFNNNVFEMFGIFKSLQTTEEIQIPLTQNQPYKFSLYNNIYLYFKNNQVFLINGKELDYVKITKDLTFKQLRDTDLYIHSKDQILNFLKNFENEKLIIEKKFENEVLNILNKMIEEF